MQSGEIDPGPEIWFVVIYVHGHGMECSGVLDLIQLVIHALFYENCLV